MVKLVTAQAQSCPASYWVYCIPHLKVAPVAACIASKLAVSWAMRSALAFWAALFLAMPQEAVVARLCVPISALTRAWVRFSRSSISCLRASSYMKPGRPSAGQGKKRAHTSTSQKPQALDRLEECSALGHVVAARLCGGGQACRSGGFLVLLSIEDFTRDWRSCCMTWESWPHSFSLLAVTLASFACRETISPKICKSSAQMSSDKRFLCLSAKAMSWLLHTRSSRCQASHLCIEICRHCREANDAAGHSQLNALCLISTFQRLEQPLLESSEVSAFRRCICSLKICE